MEVLQFVFTDLPHFVGTVILLAVILQGISGIVGSFRGTTIINETRHVRPPEKDL